MEDDKKLQEEFIQFLAEKSGAKNQQDLEKYINSLKKEELQSLYQEFYETKKQKKQKAAHGAKLRYFKNLKNRCEADEEVVYFKEGGQVKCGCKKKGGTVEEKVCPKCGKVHKAGEGCLLIKKAFVGTILGEPKKPRKAFVTPLGTVIKFNTETPYALKEYYDYTTNYPTPIQGDVVTLVDPNGNTIKRIIDRTPRMDGSAQPADTTYFANDINGVSYSLYQGEPQHKLATSWFNYLYNNARMDGKTFKPSIRTAGYKKPKRNK